MKNDEILSTRRQSESKLFAKFSIWNIDFVRPSKYGEVNH